MAVVLLSVFSLTPVHLVPVGRSWCSGMRGGGRCRCGVVVHRLVHIFGYLVLGFSCGGISLLNFSGALGVITHCFVDGLGWGISRFICSQLTGVGVLSVGATRSQPIASSMFSFMFRLKWSGILGVTFLVLSCHSIEV